MLIPTGCAQVNPSADYRRAATEVIAATGQAAVYDPTDDARARQMVSELLGNGMTAEDSVRIALLNNPTLQAAFFRIGMARADLVQSGLFSNPSLAFSLQFPEGGGRSNLQASLAQNIVDLWQVPVRRRVAEGTLTETVLTIAREGTQLAADAKAAYFAAVAADRNLSIVKENLDVAQGLLKATLARQKAGAVGELDVNLARSPALNAELEVRTARLDVGTARRRLATLLGLTIKAEDLNLTDPLPQPPESSLSPDQVVEVALSARLDLKAARQATSVAEERVREEYLQVFPNIEVGPFLERTERRALPGRNILADTARSSVAAGSLTAPDIQSRGQRNQERRQEIDSILGPALTMTLPIFDQNQAQIAKAEYAYQQALRQLDAIERSVVQETRQAVDRAMTAWEVARFYETQIVPQAQKSLDLSDTSYQAGKTSIVTVLEAQRTLLATRRIAIDALRTAAVTIADLERITGRPATVLLSKATTASQPTTDQDAKPTQERTPAQSSSEVQP
ncbi:MAG TPA: TolC family protein [Phycisphaerae bacterium]|nr:TolC family protein [Phycisphaerae bacterium]